jgi:hypothetical protein
MQGVLYKDPKLDPSKEFREESGKLYQTYFSFRVEFQPIFLIPEELSDAEIVQLAQQGGGFKDLEAPEENIYTLSDGAPL